MTDDFADYVRNAINWAESMLGSTEYRFRCLGFVEDAYEKANSVEVFGADTAKGSADEYGAAANAAMTAPAGAFVFYDYTGALHGECKNWGHVGLSIGDGKIIHSWDRIRIDDCLAVENLTGTPGWSKPKYIGWAPVERIFKGFKRLKA